MSLRMMMLTAGACSLFGIAIPAHADFQRYRVELLPSDDPASTVCPCYFPQAISDNGLAAGFFFGVDGTYNAFRQQGIALADIGPAEADRVFARAINNAGYTVGWTDFFEPQHAFLYDGTQFINLGGLDGGYSDANDINNVGDIVGNSNNHGVLWRDGQIHDLGTIGGFFGEAMAINDNGLIVGSSWNEDRDILPVYWNADLTGPFELAQIPGDLFNAAAVDVNAAGQVVGSVVVLDSAFPDTHGLLWNSVTDQPVELGVLENEAGNGESIYGEPSMTSSAPAGINDAGMIAGMVFPQQDAPFLRTGPFVWQSGKMRNLNDLLVLDDSDWVITDVAGISNNGIVAATARLSGDGNATAVRLVPVTSTVEDIDGSGAVNLFDLLVMLDSWGACGTMCPADVDGNNVVDLFDLLALLDAWGG